MASSSTPESFDWQAMGKRFAQALKSQPIIWNKKVEPIIGDKNRKAKKAERFAKIDKAYGIILEDLRANFSGEALHFYDYSDIQNLKHKYLQSRSHFSTLNRAVKNAKVIPDKNIWYLYEDYKFLEPSLNQRKLNGDGTSLPGDPEKSPLKEENSNHIEESIKKHFATALKSQPIIWDKQFLGRKVKKSKRLLKIDKAYITILDELRAKFQKEALGFYKFHDIQSLKKKYLANRNTFSSLNRAFKNGKVKPEDSVWFLYEDYKFLEPSLNQRKLNRDETSLPEVPENSSLEEIISPFKEENTSSESETEQAMKNIEELLQEESKTMATQFMEVQPSQNANQNNNNAKEDPLTADPEVFTEMSKEEHVTKRGRGRPPKRLKIDAEPDQIDQRDLETEVKQSEQIREIKKRGRPSKRPREDEDSEAEDKLEPKSLKSETYHNLESENGTILKKEDIDSSSTEDEQFANLVKSYLSMVKNPGKKLRLHGEILQTIQKYLMPDNK